MKVAFFFCVGTDGVGDWPILDTMAGFKLNIGKAFKKKETEPTDADKIPIAIYGWSPDGNHPIFLHEGAPVSDPFPRMLNPDKFDSKVVPYPHAGIGSALSMDRGVENVIAEINKLPVGQPFCLGGYSQGAAVMSRVYKEIRYGSLTSRAPWFLGATTFGNPMREVNHRGAVGGTWSGSLLAPGSTGGGHGAFPHPNDDPVFGRLVNTESKWVDFAHHTEMVTSLGDSPDELNFVDISKITRSYSPLELLTVWPLQAAHLIASTAVILEATRVNNEFTDAYGREVSFPGAGHTAYPIFPPPGNPDNGLTHYQIALKYLDGLADEWARAPISVPSTSAGWSTSLRLPAV